MNESWYQPSRRSKQSYTLEATPKSIRAEVGLSVSNSYWHLWGCCEPRRLNCFDVNSKEAQGIVHQEHVPESSKPSKMSRYRPQHSKDWQAYGRKVLVRAKEIRLNMFSSLKKAVTNRYGESTLHGCYACCFVGESSTSISISAHGINESTSWHARHIMRRDAFNQQTLDWGTDFAGIGSQFDHSWQTPMKETRRLRKGRSPRNLSSYAFSYNGMILEHRGRLIKSRPTWNKRNAC